MSLIILYTSVRSFHSHLYSKENNPSLSSKNILYLCTVDSMIVIGYSFFFNWIARSQKLFTEIVNMTTVVKQTEAEMLHSMDLHDESRPPFLMQSCQCNHVHPMDNCGQYSSSSLTSMLYSSIITSVTMYSIHQLMKASITFCHLHHLILPCCHLQVSMDLYINGPMFSNAAY